MNPLKLLRPFVIAAMVFAPIPVARATTAHYDPQTVTLAAATATKIPALVGLCGYTIINNDTASIYLGFDSTVTASNGIPIASTASYSLAVTYQSDASGTRLWLYSTGGTSSVIVAGAC